MRLFILLALIIGLCINYVSATCGACCSTGNCLTAFRGTEGICCGVRAIDDAFSKPYCCPTNSRCIDDNSGGYKCQLLTLDISNANATPNTSTNANKNMLGSKSSSSGLKWWHWLLIAIGCALALALVCWGIYKLVNYYQYSSTEKVMMNSNNGGVEVRL